MEQASHEEIKELVESGVLGPELCPEPTYWHWPVLDPERLPQKFQADLVHYGEVRFY